MTSPDTDMLHVVRVAADTLRRGRVKLDNVVPGYVAEVEAALAAVSARVTAIRNERVDVPTMTTKQFAALHKVSTRTVRRWIAADRIEAERPKGTRAWRIPISTSDPSAS